MTPDHPRYSVEQQQRYRELFAPTARMHRSGKRRIVVMLAIASVFLLLRFGLPKSFAVWIDSAALVCGLVMVVYVLSNPPLECPACRSALDTPQLGGYCPECGAAGFKPGNLLQPAQCAACGRSFQNAKSRRYTIRACSHCGLMLDEEGL